MINLYEGFLQEHDFLEMQKISNEFLQGNIEDIENKLKNDENVWTNEKWGEELKADSNPVLSYRNNEVMDKIARIVFDRVERKVQDCLFHFWLPGSHIPWHNDTTFSGAMTIYLNDEWNINHGGLFLFSLQSKEDIDKGDVVGIFPKRNRAVEQIGGMWHSVSALTNNAKIRQTIQIFYK